MEVPVDVADRPIGREQRIPVAIIILVGLAARLLCIVWWHQTDFSHSDSWEYIALARNLRFHRTFSSAVLADPVRPTTYRPPLYPAVIAALWWDTEVPATALLLLQALLGAGTAGLVYLVALRAFTKRIALVAGLAMAVAPLSCRYTALVMTETVFTFLAMLGVFYWSAKKPLMAGFVFALAILARAVLLPFIVVLPLLALIRAWRPFRREHLLITCGALLTIAPWTARNAVVSGKVIPVASAGWGSNLLQGTIPVGFFSGNPIDTVLQHPSRQIDLGHSWEAEHILLERGLRRIVESPGQWLLARLEQYPRLFMDHGEYMYPQWRPGAIAMKVIFLAGNFIVLALACLGILAERRRFVQLRYLTLVLAFLTLSQLPMWVEVRYSLPLMPMILIFAAVGARWLGTTVLHGSTPVAPADQDLGP